MARNEHSGRGRLAIIVAVFMALVCCGGTVTFVWQQYEGPSRSRDRIAIIRTTGASPTVLVAIDGKSILAPLDEDNRLHVEILPGVHEVDVAAPSLGLRRVIPVRMLAEAGKVYRLAVSARPQSPSQPDNAEPPLWNEQWQAHAYEVDRDSDAPRGIADVPAAPAPASRSPAAPRSSEDAAATGKGGAGAVARDAQSDAGTSE
jgi:hypothetical protein